MRFFHVSLLALMCVGVFSSCSDDEANAPQTATVSGVVRSTGGKALADANVSVERHSDGRELGRTRTDGTGVFVLRDLPLVLMDLRIEATGFEPLVFESMDPVNAAESMQDLSISLTAVNDSVCCNGVLTVTVKDQNGSPVPSAVVRLWKSGNMLQKMFTDASGVAVVTNLCQGEYGVDVTKDGLTEREFTFAINEYCDPYSKTIEMEFLACCSGVFTLVVRDAQNNPVTGAKVQVRKGSKELEAPITNSSGRIVVDGLCAGEYNYRVSKEGYKVVEGPFAIDTNCTPVTKEAMLEITPQVCCSGVLTVIVRDPQNQPVTGALVRLWKNGSKIRQVLTNASGLAVFDSLCAAVYAVDVLKDGWTDREFSFSINESCDPVTKEVTMEQKGCCSGVLTLVVRDAQNNPVAGAKVQVRKGSKELEAPITDANGRIVVDGLCEGEYNYRISKEGYKVLEGVFAINNNCDPYNKTIELFP
ncbi:MAG: carboxypeptidase regulatory-like domain-containing protein [Bacteroidetes bacterium]|nr:carboxypeptidase regulatory-like domain-containing protein [Bacteroidota bacterium]